MPQVTYIPDFSGRIILNELPPGKPERVSIVAPTIVRPGRPFTIKLAVHDENSRISVWHKYFDLHFPEANINGLTVELLPDKPAIVFLDNITINKPGFSRMRAYMNDRVFYSNPILCSDEEENEIFWGDPHIHTVLSRCHHDKCRTLNFAYTAAKYLSALDWAAMADHVSNGRCDASKWKEQATVSNLYNESGKFVTLPAYEASFKGGAGGDCNVYMDKYAGMYCEDYENGTMKTVCENLKKKSAAQGFDFFTVPHHTTRPGKHGEIGDAIFPGKEIMPVIEIHSKWGTSEYRGNPHPLQEIHPGPSYAVDLLNRGLKLGFIGGTDTHSTMTYGKGFEPPHLYADPGITAVMSPELSRDSIYKAIKNRHCYAAMLERIYLKMNVNGNIINVIAAGQSDIQSIEIIKNGKTVHKHEPSGTWQENILYKDEDHSDKAEYYYTRITCKSGAMAWSSPHWPD